MALSLSKRSESSSAAVPVVPVVIAGYLLTGESAPLSDKPPLNGKMYLRRGGVARGRCAQGQLTYTFLALLPPTTPPSRTIPEQDEKNRRWLYSTHSTGGRDPPPPCKNVVVKQNLVEILNNA